MGALSGRHRVAVGKASRAQVVSARPPLISRPSKQLRAGVVFLDDPIDADQVVEDDRAFAGYLAGLIGLSAGTTAAEEIRRLYDDPGYPLPRR